MRRQARAELLRILCGGSWIRLSAHGCGGGVEFCYRVMREGSTALFGRDGRVVSGKVSDEELLALAKDVVRRLVMSIELYEEKV